MRDRDGEAELGAGRLAVELGVGRLAGRSEGSGATESGAIVGVVG